VTLPGDDIAVRSDRRVPVDDREVLAELRKLSQLVAEFVEPGRDQEEDSEHVLRSAETRRLLDAFGS